MTAGKSLQMAGATGLEPATFDVMHFETRLADGSAARSAPRGDHEVGRAEPRWAPVDE
jgi:hypothetical protein